MEVFKVFPSIKSLGITVIEFMFLMRASGNLKKNLSKNKQISAL